MGKVESPAVRWATAVLFLGVELLLWVVILDPGDGSRYEVTRANQLLMIIVSLSLFVMLPSILKGISQEDDPFEYAATQVESRQRRRAAFVTGSVDALARMIRIETTGPLIAWIAVGFLTLLASATVTESVSGPSIKLILSTGVYLLFAAFAAPPVRSYLQQKFGLEFPRLVVAGTLIAGVLLNEAILVPPPEEPAVVITRVSLNYIEGLRN